jgi:hypothetical protein
MRDRRRVAAGALALLVVALSTWGCASTQPPEVAESVESPDAYRVSCEASLIELERLLALRSSQDDFPKDALIEAQELYRLGRELYLEREYVLALDMIEEGIQLVEEQHH